MAMKVEIISSGNTKPSTLTPDHLRDFKMCLLDELAPPSYVPILLLYSSDEFGSNYIVADNASMLEKLKSSLSETLSRFYPFCGTLIGNVSVECSDNGALYVETRVDGSVLEIVKNPETELLYKLFPFNPYRTKMDREAPIMGVQVNVFRCGGIGIGVCISHKIADGTTMATFLNAWAATATGVDRTQSPRLDSALIFPPKGVDLIKQSDMIRNDKIVTKRFEFSGKNLTSLKSKISSAVGNTTRVEAVTALIWKSAMQATKHNSGKKMFPPAIATHLVNIRGRVDPPLPENSVGNLWRLAIAPYKDAKEGVELHELVKILKERIRKIDNDCISELKGENGFYKAIEPLKEMRELALGGEALEVYTFSSWTRFPLYEMEFGWGRPVKVCTLTVPVRNCVVLMGTKCGHGIEAWVTLTEDAMKVFECNRELLQFVSTYNA